MDAVAITRRPAIEVSIPKPELDGKWPLMTQVAIFPWHLTQDAVNSGAMEHAVLVPRAQWEAAKEGRCVACGCTEQRACSGGCAWFEPGLCTACAGEEFIVEFN